MDTEERHRNIVTLAVMLMAWLLMLVGFAAVTVEAWR